MASDNSVYVTIYGPDVNTMVYSLDAITGRLLWDFTSNSVIDPETWAFNQLMVNGGSVYFVSGFSPSFLYSLDATSGEVNWQNRYWNYPLALAANDGNVYHMHNLNVVSLKADSGTLNWSYRMTTGFSDEPVAVANETVYFPGGEGATIYGFDVDNGNVKWKIQLGKDNHDYFLASKIETLGDRLYHAGPGGLYSLDGDTGEVAWLLDTDFVRDFTLNEGIIYGAVYRPYDREIFALRVPP